MDTSDSEHFESADEEVSNKEDSGNRQKTKNLNISLEKTVQNLNVISNKNDELKKKEISRLISRYTANNNKIEEKNEFILEETSKLKIEECKSDENIVGVNKCEKINEKLNQSEGSFLCFNSSKCIVQDNEKYTKSIRSENKFKVSTKQSQNDEDSRNISGRDFDDFSNACINSANVQFKNIDAKMENHFVAAVKKSPLQQCWEPETNYFPKKKEVIKNIEIDEPKNVWKNDDEFKNMWKNNEWEPFDDMKSIQTNSDQTLNSSAIKNESTTSVWGGWGNWDLSSVLSTATASVSTISSRVTLGLSTVLESSIGVPDPEELAKQYTKENKQEDSLNKLDEPTNEASTGIGIDLGNFVSGVSHITKFVEKTGSKVIAGGLDTLETIGKKTMEVLQENDPGLKKKRTLLKFDHNKPTLSQILREAKEKAEQENEVLEKKHIVKKLNYETLFDDCQGLVHLEALEMLSKQCVIKLQSVMESLRENELVEMQETMDQVKELCALPEDDEEGVIDSSNVKEKIGTAVSEMNIPISYGKLLTALDEVIEWMDTYNFDINEKDIHEKAIESLAYLTALAVEQYHKAGELLLTKEHRSTVDEADSLVQ